MATGKEVLTTGEVAKICNVAPRTVSKWFDAGHLKGYRIPGSKDRRIPVNQLVKFMKNHGIPLDGLLTDQIRVLIVDSEPEVLTTIKKLLNEQTDYEVNTASDGFQAGLQCAEFKPHVLLLDLHLGNGEGHKVAEMIQSNDDLQLTKIIAMSGKLTDGQSASCAGRASTAS